MMRFVSGLFCLGAVLIIATGCSSEKPRSHVSGTVKFKGKLVPAGAITFMPNASKGNPGPATVAVIKEGKYDTAQEANSGIYPGEYIVTISGFDGKVLPDFPQGKQIFNPHEVRTTFPDGTSTKDFDVPQSAAEDLKIVPNSGDTGS